MQPRQLCSRRHGPVISDAGTLADSGYTLRQVIPVDQFVHTAHLELVALFQREAAGA